MSKLPDSNYVLSADGMNEERSGLCVGVSSARLQTSAWSLTSSRNRSARTYHRGCKAFIILCFLVMASVNGCVHVDSKTWTEEINKEATIALSANFTDRAIYKSSGGAVAEDRLSKLLSINIDEVESIRISFIRDVGLSVQFERQDKYVVTKTIRFEDGLELTDEGKIMLPVKRSCGSVEGLMGCVRLRNFLFVNKEGSLVVAQQGEGAGLFGPFPVGSYARLIAKFAKRD